MKRSLALLTALLLLSLAAVPALAAQIPDGAKKIADESMQYSTLVPESAHVSVDGESVFIYVEEDGYIPYIEIDKEVGKRYDTARYLSEILTGDMKSRYGSDLRTTSIMEYCSVGGKELPTALFTYKVGEYTVYFMQSLELNGNDTVFYTAKYLAENKDATMNALDMAVRYYQPDAHYYDTQAAKPQGKNEDPLPAATPVPAATAVPQQPASGDFAMAMMHIKDEEMRVGQCMAPVGYTILPVIDICGPTRNFSIPAGLDIIAQSPDGRIVMAYESASSFLEIVSSTQGGKTYRTHENGKIDPETLTVMAKYPQPSAYAATFLAGMYPDVETAYVGSRDLSAYQSVFQQMAQTKYDALKAGNPELVGGNVDGVAVTADICAFSGKMNGEDYYFVVGTIIEASQMTMTMPMILVGNLVETDILWSPLCTYVLACPVAEIDSVYPAFEIFMENTTASDQFIQTTLSLGDQLRQIIADGRIQSGQSYCRSALIKATSKDETYQDDRFTDYIYDQNDYTLSDGTHVKISTAYDHVYEGDNGVVYFTDSAFPQPGTQLTPNR